MPILFYGREDLSELTCPWPMAFKEVRVFKGRRVVGRLDAFGPID